MGSRGGGAAKQSKLSARQAAGPTALTSLPPQQVARWPREMPALPALTTGLPLPPHPNNVFPPAPPSPRTRPLSLMSSSSATNSDSGYALSAAVLSSSCGGEGGAAGRRLGTALALGEGCGARQPATQAQCLAGAGSQATHGTGASAAQPLSRPGPPTYGPASPRCSAYLLKGRVRSRTKTKIILACGAGKDGRKGRVLPAGTGS